MSPGYVIEDGSGNDIPFVARSVSFGDVINRRGQALFSVDKDDASFPLDRGEAVYIKGANFAANSEDATAWSATNITVTANAVANPYDGLTTADHIEADNTAGACRLSGTAIGLSHTGTVVYTTSVYIKADAATWVWVGEGGGASWHRAWFNLSTQAIGTTAGIDKAGIESLDNGWFRIWVKYTDATANHAIVPYVGLSPSDGSDSALHTGDAWVFGLHFARASSLPVYNKTTSTRLTHWSGVVDEITETDILLTSQTERRLIYSCIDNDEVVGRRLVAATYTAKTFSYIVNDLITNYLDGDGITAGDISTGPTHPVVVFPYIPVSQALDELCERSNFFWHVDKAGALNAHERDFASAPWHISGSSKPYLSMKVTRNRSRYRNTQYVRGGYAVQSAEVEVALGDGNKKSFTLGYEVSAMTSVEVDTGGGYAAATFGVRGRDTGKDWYYEVGSQIISQDSGDTALSATDKIRVTYDGRYRIISVSTNSAEITARASAESRSGKYESAIVDETIEDVDQAIELADALNTRFGIFPDIVEYVTDKPGLEAGQIQTITLTDHALSGTYLIESVSAQDSGAGNLRYSVRAVSGDATGAHVAYWKDLRRAARSLSIREDETLFLIRQAYDGLGIADDATPATSTSHGFTVGTSAYLGAIDWG